MDGGDNDLTQSQLVLRHSIAVDIAFEQLDVIFLLDDSSSISEADFMLMGVVCSNICQHLSSNARFAVITFHASSSLVCEFKADKEVALNKIKTYQRTCGSTNIKAGYEHAKRLFEASQGRASAKRLVFTITDGEADPSSNPVNAARELMQMNVTIYCIGVGKQAKIESLQKISSPNCALHVRDMRQLSRVLNLPKAAIRPLHVIVRASIVKTPLKFQENIQLRLEIQNIGSDDVPPGVVIAVYGGDYFHAATFRCPVDIRTNEGYTTDIIMLATGKSFAYIPDALGFTLTHPQGHAIFCKDNEISLSSENFIGSFINFKISNPAVKALNILVFGVSGCGKSSFINSIFTAFSNKVTSRANVGGSNDHTSLDYRRYEMNLTGNNIPINLWDAWGLDEDNYTADYFLKFVEGEVPHGFQMANVKLGGFEKYEDDFEDPRERRIHAVLLLVPVGIMKDPLLPRVPEILKAMNTKGLQSYIIVTRADTINPANKLSHQQEIAKRFNLPLYRVSLVRNYVEDSEKNFTIDKVTLRIFAEISQTANIYAQTYIPRNPPQYIHHNQQAPPSGPHGITPVAAPPQPNPLQHAPPQHAPPQHAPPQHVPLQHAPPRDAPPLDTPPQHAPPQYAPPQSTPPQHAPLQPIAASPAVTTPPQNSIIIDYGGRLSKPQFVDEHTTVEKIINRMARRLTIDSSRYCLESEQGVEYGLEDRIQSIGLPKLYMKEISEEYF